MLNMIKIELKIRSDVDMYLFFEKGIRDGFCYISIRCRKVRNKCLKHYHPKQES